MTIPVSISPLPEIEYDPSVAALYLHLDPVGQVDSTVEVTGSLAIDLSRDGHIVGIEYIATSSGDAEAAAVETAIAQLQAARMIRPHARPDALKYVDFRNTLRSSLEQVAIEDGYPHDAESVMTALLHTAPSYAGTWIRRALTYFERDRPAIAAGVLRCLGRLPHALTRPWGQDAARAALWDPDSEVRSEAARALEQWGQSQDVEWLQERASVEDLPWLQRYMKGVAEDLASQ